MRMHTWNDAASGRMLRKNMLTRGHCEYQVCKSKDTARA